MATVPQNNPLETISKAGSLGVHVDKFVKKNPATAKMDEKSEQLKGITRDSIKKIRAPRNQARKIDSTINKAGKSVCDTVGTAIQGMVMGQLTPAMVGAQIGIAVAGGVDSILKDGIGAKDVKGLGKKAATLGAAILADKAGLDDKLQGVLNKVDENKRKVGDIGRTKKAEDEVLKKIPPVLRKILKGDKNALKQFISQKCNEAQKNMKNDALGRSGLTGKVREFVK